MPQRLTERFKQYVSKRKKKVKTLPRVMVHHERDSDTRAYTGRTICTISYLDKKRRPCTILGEYKAEADSSRPMTKKDGYRIASERAYKKFLKNVE